MVSVKTETAMTQPPSSALARRKAARSICKWSRCVFLSLPLLLLLADNHNNNKLSMVFAVEAFVPTGVTNYSYKNRQNYQCSSFSPLSQGFRFRPPGRASSPLSAQPEEAVSTTSRSPLPSRSRTHRKNGKFQKSGAKKKGAKGTCHRPLSETELADHVSTEYSLILEKKRRGLNDENVEHCENNKMDSKQLDPSNKDYLKRLERYPALLLNADYQPMGYAPLSQMSWQEAIKAVFSGKVTVVDVYPDVKVRAASLEISLPAVVALNEYVPKFQRSPAFNRRNVFMRDGYKCQYCNNRFHSRDLSLDHVKPRCMGGLLNWENVVTACHKCNCRKGKLTVQNLSTVGMQLQRKPFVPTQYQLANVAGRMMPQRLHHTWEPYLTIGNRKKTNTDDNYSGVEPKTSVNSEVSAAVQ